MYTTAKSRGTPHLALQHPALTTNVRYVPAAIRLCWLLPFGLSHLKTYPRWTCQILVKICPASQETPRAAVLGESVTFKCVVRLSNMGKLFDWRYRQEGRPPKAAFAKQMYCNSHLHGDSIGTSHLYSVWMIGETEKFGVLQGLSRQPWATQQLNIVFESSLLRLGVGYCCPR